MCDLECYWCATTDAEVWVKDSRGREHCGDCWVKEYPDGEPEFPEPEPSAICPFCKNQDLGFPCVCQAETDCSPSHVHFLNWVCDVVSVVEIEDFDNGRELLDWIRVLNAKARFGHVLEAVQQVRDNEAVFDKCVISGYVEAL